jgi:crotonobetainyl-CoA:carnitine CoA-transferase CaiB-like acyl-CoA transferase
VTTTARPPLDGTVVVELGQSVAAPFAGQVLADLGACVIKVERPSGDDARTWGPPFLDGAAATFQALNRGKRSVVCDLRDDEARAALTTLIERHADVVIQNLRPGQVTALGLDADTLRATKPSLVYCNLGAFGHTGPLADRPGYDPLMQAFGGIMSVTGEPGRDPVRVGPSIIDMGTGLWAVVGIVSALLRRDRTGVGGVVDVSLFETAATWMSVFAVQHLASGVVPEPLGSGQAGIVPYRSFRTADGNLVVAAGNDALFVRLCGALDRESWVRDARRIRREARVEHREELCGLIEPIMATRTTAAWSADLDAAGVPNAPVQTVAEMLAHEQTTALGIVRTLDGMSQPVIGSALSFDGERPFAASRPPGLGEATAELLTTPEGTDG